MVTLAVMAAGCAPIMWERPGTTQAEFDRDNYACERDARQSGYYGGGLTGAINMQGFFQRCMTAQGYTLRTNATSSSTPAEPSSSDGLPKNDAECLVRFGVKCPDWVKRALEQQGTR